MLFHYPLVLLLLFFIYSLSTLYFQDYIIEFGQYSTKSLSYRIITCNHSLLSITYILEQFIFLFAVMEYDFSCELFSRIGLIASFISLISFDFSSMVYSIVGKTLLSNILGYASLVVSLLLCIQIVIFIIFYVSLYYIIYNKRTKILNTYNHESFNKLVKLISYKSYDLSPNYRYTFWDIVKGLISLNYLPITYAYYAG